MLTLWTKEGCMPCKMVKKLLTEKLHVSFIEEDASAEENAVEVAQRGIRSVPVLEFPDGTLIQGFQPERIKEQLQRQELI